MQSKQTHIDMLITILHTPASGKATRSFQRRCS